MASSNIARLGVVLGIDTAEWTSEINKAIEQQKNLKRQIQSQATASEKEIERLAWAVKDYGREVTLVEKIQREFLTGGKYELVQKSRQQELLKQAAALDALAASTKKANAAQIGMLTTQQKAALGYQTTDILTGLAGGQNPLLVLIQQGGQLRDQFGGFKPLFQGIMGVLNPFNIMVATAAVTVGGLAVAFYKGSKEAADFRDSLVLTNNITGINYNNFLRLAEAIGSKEYGVNAKLGDTKEILSALISSGKFTSASLIPVAEVLSKISAISGQTGEEVAKNLMGSFDGSAQSALRLNESFNFLNVAQFKYIEQLNQQGKKQEAAIYYSNLLKESLSNQTRELGSLETAVKSVTNWFSKLWDAALDVGRDTDTRKLAKLADEIELYSAFPKGLVGKQLDEAVAKYLAKAKEMREKQDALNKEADDKAKNKSELDAFNKAGGTEGQQKLERDYRKALYDEQIKEAMVGATEENRIKLEAAQKVYSEILATEETLLQKGTYNAVQEYRNRDQKIQSIIKDAEQKAENISRLKEREFAKKQFQELDSIANEKAKLELYSSSILISEQDYKISLARLENEQKIAEIMRDEILSDSAKERLVENQQKLGAAREEILKMGDRLETLRNINQSVFSNMGNAIDNFVRTGKFAFKDFARSVIQDIIAIQLKAQATRMLGGLFSIGQVAMGNALQANTGVMVDDNGVSLMVQPRASGGSVSGGSPYLVGENGPELFMPSNSGTIIPNARMNDSMGGTQVIYNGPYIANMSAIDTQSASQFLAKNKDAVWAANQSANRSIPSSR